MASEPLNDLRLKELATFLRALESATGEYNVQLSGGFEIAFDPDNNDDPVRVTAEFFPDRGEYLFTGWAE